MLIASGVFAVLLTYDSFSSEKNRFLTSGKFFAAVAFAVLSGNVLGFAVFALMRDYRVHIRIICGAAIYGFAGIFIYGSTKPAEMVFSGICLIIGIFLICLIYSGLSFYYFQKTQRTERVMSANISEMHEKRLNEELLKQNILAEKNARLIERENISRNIHNSVGHSITAAIITLEAADMLYDVKPDKARKKMNDANERMRGSLESIRRAVRVLDEEAAAISASDLKSDMENLVDEFVMDTKITANTSFVQLDDNIKIPHDDAEFLTGVLGEMLTNGVKHGNADEFFIFLSGDTSHIRLEVSDNGKSSFNSENSESKIANGFGIKKIISYAAKRGGKTSFTNDGGFKGITELPLIISDSE